MEYQLAQINIGRMTGKNIDDPVMKDFVDNLDKINALAESSDGFVWRLKDESNNASGFNPYNDEQIIINVSVWRNIESLQNFTYRTSHTDFLKRRKEWLQKPEKPHMALWWISKDAYPSIEQATQKLDYLQKYGPTEQAFTFQDIFLPS